MVLVYSGSELWNGLYVVAYTVVLIHGQSLSVSRTLGSFTMI